jgi:hypothetical protein
VRTKQGWIRYLESLETTLLDNVQRQKDNVIANIQEEISETKQIEEYIIKEKDTKVMTVAHTTLILYCAYIIFILYAHLFAWYIIL